MLNLTKRQFITMINKAYRNSACGDQMKIIESVFESKGIKGLMEHKNLPHWLYWYSSHVMKKRWHEAEAAIMADASWAYMYAKYVIEGRWCEAEAVIMTDARWACAYAQYVIKGRWHEAEKIIMTNKDYYNSYQKFIKELEE